MSFWQLIFFNIYYLTFSNSSRLKNLCAYENNIFTKAIITSNKKLNGLSV